MKIDITRSQNGSLIVRVDGYKLTPKPSLRVVNHSPTGFEIGYDGSGPSQLALAILLRAGLTTDHALDLYMAFRREFIATHQAPCILDIDIDAWVAKQRRQGDTTLPI